MIPLAQPSANRPTLTLSSIRQRRITKFEEVLDKLKKETAQEFKSDLVNICIAYMGGGNWKRTIVLAKRNFRIGSKKAIIDYLNVLDEEMIDYLSRDFTFNQNKIKIRIDKLKS